MTTTPTPSINVIVPTGTAVGPWTTGWTYSTADDVWMYIETDGAPGPDLIDGVDYTLTGATPEVNGGSVTLAAPTVPEGGWTEAHRVILRRWTVRRQGVALPDTEGHKPRATERALDRAMRIAEEVSDDLDLAIKIAPGGDPVSAGEVLAAGQLALDARDEALAARDEAVATVNYALPFEGAVVLAASQRFRNLGANNLDFILNNEVPHASVLDGSNMEPLTGYLQAMHDGVPEGEELSILGANRLPGTLEITKGHDWNFGTPDYSPTPNAEGAIIRPTADGSTLFRIRRGEGQEVRGLRFRGANIFETAHPAPSATPGTPWAPANYGYVFDSYGTAGEVIVENIYAPGIRRFRKSVASGRAVTRGVKACVFGTFLHIDQAYDRDTIENNHLWPYNWANANVYDWQMASDEALFELYRVDTPLFDQNFAFNGGKFMRCNQVYYGAYLGPYADTAAYLASATEANPFPAVYATGTNGGIAEPGSPHAFNVTNLGINECYIESFKDGVIIDALNVSGTISALTHVGDFGGNNAPIIGGASLRLNGANPKIIVAAWKSNRLDGSAILGAGDNPELTLASSFFDDVNRGAAPGGRGAAIQPIINLTGANPVVRFGAGPIVRNSYGASLGVAVVPLQQNTVANQVADWLAEGAAAGGAVRFFPNGPNQRAAIGSTGNQPFDIYQGETLMLQAAADGVRVNQGSATKYEVFSTTPATFGNVADGADCAVTFGVPGSDETWGILAVWSSAIQAAAVPSWKIGVPWYAGSSNWVVIFTNNTGATSGLLNGGNIHAIARKMVA